MTRQSTLTCSDLFRCTYAADSASCLEGGVKLETTWATAMHERRECADVERRAVDGSGSQRLRAASADRVLRSLLF